MGETYAHVLPDTDGTEFGRVDKCSNTRVGNSSLTDPKVARGASRRIAEQDMEHRVPYDNVVFRETDADVVALSRAAHNGLLGAVDTADAQGEEPDPIDQIKKDAYRLSLLWSYKARTPADDEFLRGFNDKESVAGGGCTVLINHRDDLLADDLGRSLLQLLMGRVGSVHYGDGAKVVADMYTPAGGRHRVPRMTFSEGSFEVDDEKRVIRIKVRKLVDEHDQVPILELPQRDVLRVRGHKGGKWFHPEKYWGGSAAETGIDKA